MLGQRSKGKQLSPAVGAFCCLTRMLTKHTYTVLKLIQMRSEDDQRGRQIQNSMLSP